VRLTKVAQFDDGTTEYSGVDSDGDITLYINQDGRGPYWHRIVGFCGLCFTARAQGESSCGFPGHPPVQSGSSGPADVAVPASVGVPPEFLGRERLEPRPEPEPKKRSWFRDRVTVPTNAQNGAPDDDGSIVTAVERKPAVPPEVARQAEIVAKDLWQISAPLSMAQLAERHQRPVAVVEPLVAHAVTQGWLARAGVKVVKGAVSPFPVVDIPDVDGPAWGPGEPLTAEKPDDPVGIWHGLRPKERASR
jgi:hypothetical protein